MLQIFWLNPQSEDLIITCVIFIAFSSELISIYTKMFGNVQQKHPKFEFSISKKIF